MDRCTLKSLDGNLLLLLFYIDFLSGRTALLALHDQRLDRRVDKNGDIEDEDEGDAGDVAPANVVQRLHSVDHVLDRLLSMCLEKHVIVREKEVRVEPDKSLVDRFHSVVTFFGKRL